MASHKLTGFIVLNEIANFKGTPDKLKESLEKRFPKFGTKKFSRQISEAMSRGHYNIDNNSLSALVQSGHVLEY